MEMTIDEHMAQLKKLKTFHNGSYGASINFAMDIMRKYQKIEEIKMAVIDRDKFITYLIWSGLVDKATCGELKEAIEQCTVKDIYTKDDLAAMLTDIRDELAKNYIIDPDTGEIVSGMLTNFKAQKLLDRIDNEIDKFNENGDNALNIMRKYQKILEIFDKYDKGELTHNMFGILVGEVIEDKQMTM